MNWKFGWNDPITVATRRAWGFLVVGAVALATFRMLESAHLSIAFLSVAVICYLGYRADGWLFGYFEFDDLSAKIAFSAVMAVFFAAGWLYLQGASWWLGGSAYVIASTGYHVWQMRRRQLFERFGQLSPKLRLHWRSLRRAYKPMNLQADMLRTRAVGQGEIGNFRLDLRVLVDNRAVEVYADAIPGAPVSIPWPEIEYFRVTPRGDAGELRAHFRVRKFPNMPIVVPWLAEFARVAPKSAS